MLIQKLRLQRGWSQEQLATVSGLSVRTIQRIEHGQSASLETLSALASVFEVDVSQLTEPQETKMPDFTGNSTAADEAIAFERVRRIKAYYMQVIRCIVILTMLTAINLVTNPNYIWVIWPALVWIVALALKGLSIFELVPFLNADWEKKKVETYLGRKL